MSSEVPVLRIGETVIAALQGDLDDATVLKVEETITRQVSQAHTTGVLLDVSNLAVVDTFIARVLARVVAMVRLLGAHAAVVGIQPAVAITLVELGIPMGDLHTALNAEQGMALLQRLEQQAATPE